MRNAKNITILLMASLLLSAGFGTANDLTPAEQLGKSIFFDINLSLHQNQSCAVCHGPEVGFTGPISDFNAHGATYEGSISGLFGNRKPPTAAYATLSPVLHIDEEGLFVGGNFWDGRATGEDLGNPAADQSLGPFLNHVEQALPDSACIVYRVCNPVVPADYPVSFETVWGTEACDIVWPADIQTLCATDGFAVTLSDSDRAKSDAAYNNVGLSIAAFEGSPEVNAFSSKFDIGNLTKLEKKGLNLFNGKAKCNLCHISEGEAPLFTDFTYDNLGFPKNPENPVYDTEPLFVDQGLGGFLQSSGYPEDVYEEEMGNVKVPTLRNLDLRPDEGFVKAYGHNGYFKTLKGIVHFYNSRDVKQVCPGDYTEPEALAADCWPLPEVSENVNTDELGNLSLTAAEEDALVAFLKTLSDGHIPGPDLSGSWTSLAQIVKDTKNGTKAKINGTLEIQNSGDQDAPSSSLRFYLSDDDAYDENDSLLKQIAAGQVKAQKNKNKKLQYSFPIDESAAGKYIVAVLDADNSVAETTEGNNVVTYGPVP